jgi:hypothetical protein
MNILETVDDKHINTYSLSNITNDELSCLARYIKYNPKIKEVRINGMRWIRKIPKDIWNDTIEQKIKLLSSEYAKRDILAGDIFWIGCKKMPYDLHNSLILELHTTKSITFEEYREKCILDTMEKVISDNEFNDIIN